MAKKKKKAAVDLTLWDVILSYPDLHDPKPFKGKVYYKTDILLDQDHPQLMELKKAITKVKRETWGDDKTEWPKSEKPLIQDGNARQDSQGYKDRRFIIASTQTPVPVVNPKGQPFNPQMVKGGMFANVAIRISAWEFDGDEGVSIYLSGVQIDTSKKSLNFGGGRSVEQMFNLKNTDEDTSDGVDTDEDGGEDSWDVGEDDEDGEETYTPKNKKKTQSHDEDYAE